MLSTRKLDIGYTLLVLLVLMQETALFLHLYWYQQYTVMEMIVSLAIVPAVLIGYYLPLGVSIIVTFVFLVSYLVWLATFAPANAIIYSWYALIPASLLATAFIRQNLIRTKNIAERLQDLEKRIPEVDLDTSLSNRESFTFTLIKQANLAKRYPEQFHFSLSMFKIEFLPLVQELLGREGYAQFLLQLSDAIQQQLRYEDYKFWIGEGRFVVLCPLTNPDYLGVMTERIKNALLQIEVMDKNNQVLQFVLRAGSMPFHPEKFVSADDVDAIIALLERETETDLVAEYV